ncbi:MAG: peptidoglycan synthetase [Bacteroidales bacterium]|nr:peptidoglycan synthetase [Bacteroidales bacterium]
MKFHFIAIGGAAMHNIAIALHNQGHEVTGSDDEIFEPSRSRLAAHGLLPENPGWHPGKITQNINAVILGMHARIDNPELLKAQQLKLKIYSFPEFLYEQTKHKKRIVIGGSHGKTTITSMIMHVLKNCGVKFDYMVGSQVQGFDTMAGISEESELAVFEGDEYLASPVDTRPKFHLYKPHIAVISGIAWDHINVFPTFGNYCLQFKTFTEKIEQNGSLIYFSEDENIAKIVDQLRPDILAIPYSTHAFITKEGKTYLKYKKKNIQIAVFGKHNMQNISAAFKVCLQAGIGEDDFFKAISSFRGANKRLQLLAEKENCAVFLDFAHSPSKLKATIEAVKSQFPARKLLACMELHTFSSLTEKFLDEYKNTMQQADEKVIYYNPVTIEHKGLSKLTHEKIKNAFGDSAIRVFSEDNLLKEFLFNNNWTGYTILLMSSGNFSNIDFRELINKL